MIFASTYLPQHQDHLRHVRVKMSFAYDNTKKMPGSFLNLWNCLDVNFPEYKYFCGTCTVIGNNLILTAAHNFVLDQDAIEKDHDLIFYKMFFSECKISFSNNFIKLYFDKV